MAMADDLTLIPRAVRDKLDLVAIKLHLAEWSLLTLEERRLLCDLPCGSAQEISLYRDEVEARVLARTGKTADRLPTRS